MEYEGYTNIDLFLTWVENCLCKGIKPNQVVVMDNASFHKSDRVKHLIENAGGRLMYLPPYYPDLNSIEHVWANLKRLLRKHPKREQDLSWAISESIGNLILS